MYQGQLLPDLTVYTALEYVLKCIPALQAFHTMRAKEYQENLMAAAVILRQYEEIEEEHISADEGVITDDTRLHVDEQVNFLAITQAIIKIAESSPNSQGLANAAFFISVRQEVYCAFIRERAPQIHIDRASWGAISAANKAVIHAAEVTKWRWGDKSDAEWCKFSVPAGQSSCI